MASKFPELWMELQNDLARWSTAGKSVTLDGRIADPIYEAPEAVIEACRQVLRAPR